MPTLRFGGRHFLDDEAFLSSGKAEAARLQQFGLRAGHTLLEIGCGTGRLVYGLRGSLVGCNYVGIDVYKSAIDWCQENLTSLHHKFVHVDVQNDRYNAGGSDPIKLPVDHADFVYAYSVFSHLQPPDVAAYADEIKRVLPKDGLALLTAFVEQNVPGVEVNPKGYGMEWDGPLHCVRYELMHFLHAFAERGLHLKRMDHGTETDGQSMLLFRRAA